MPEKDKPTQSTPMSDADHAALWEQTAQKIFLQHLPMGRVKVSMFLRAKLSQQRKYLLTLLAKFAGTASLPPVKATNSAPPLVAVKYENPDSPGEYITRMEPADTDITMPNLPIDHPQSQRCLTDPRHEKKQLAEAR